MIDSGYIQRTQEAVADYERQAEARRLQHARAAERGLIMAAAAIILARAASRRQAW